MADGVDQRNAGPADRIHTRAGGLHMFGKRAAVALVTTREFGGA